MTDYCQNKDCPACKIKATILDLKQEGYPEELIIRMVLDVMSSLLEDTVLVAEEMPMEYGVVH